MVADFTRTLRVTGAAVRVAAKTSATKTPKITVLPTACAIDAGQVDNLRATPRLPRLPPPGCGKRGSGQIGNRPDPERTPAKLPHKVAPLTTGPSNALRSEEHTSELQSPCNLVC